MSPAIRIPDIAGKTVAMLGLGRTGLATAQALSESGAEVWAWDDNEKARAQAPAEIIVDLEKADWSKPRFLAMSPGIPHTYPKPHPVAALAKKANVPLIGDIELLHRANPKARYVCITGTNGKSTTTTLIAHVLRQGGKRIEVGGNLGQAALSLLPLGPDGIYVLELSSYQLELIPNPISNVGVLLNITPDHLGRHGGLEGYIAAKKRIFAPKGDGGIGIIGVDDEHCRQIYAELKYGPRRMIPISVGDRVAAGVYVLDGRLIDNIEGGNELVTDLTAASTLPGSHNWQNAAAAYVAARALGLSRESIVTGLHSYPGLAHRQELIAAIGPVRYINDSKATNADATAKALACYDNMYWIIGGQAKEGGLAGLEAYYPRIRHAFLIGEASDAFAQQLGSALPFTQCGTLSKAVGAAHEMAQKSGDRAVVLLSPACASWDQYPNFEARGDEFRQLVQALAGKADA